MNRSLVGVGGEVLLVSQFTLLGDTTKGVGRGSIRQLRRTRREHGMSRR